MFLEWCKQSRTAISNYFTVQPPLGLKLLSNPRLTVLKKNISKESGEVRLPNSVKTTDYDPGSQSHNLELKSPWLSNKGWLSKSANFSPGLKDPYSIRWQQSSKPFSRFQLTLCA